MEVDSRLTHLHLQFTKKKFKVQIIGPLLKGIYTLYLYVFDICISFVHATDLVFFKCSLTRVEFSKPNIEISILVTKASKLRSFGRLYSNFSSFFSLFSSLCSSSFSLFSSVIFFLHFWKLFCTVKRVQKSEKYNSWKKYRRYHAKT